MNTSELVLSIPHASTYIPPEIRALMPHDENILLNEPDLYTDKIYTIEGPAVVHATVSRIISDVNRAPDEIYTEGPQRSYGVVMLSQSHGNDIFERDPSLSTMEGWVQTFHVPFHTKLEAAMKNAQFLIDCHSHWSLSPPSRFDAGTERADIVLGNRHYTTCDAQTLQFFRHAFENLGYTVAINNPFIGRYTIGIHCSRLRTPGLQIEIKRSIYMDEDTLEPYENVLVDLKEKFQTLVHAFCAWDDSRRTGEHLCDISS